jgi:hypothetical protein
MKHSKVIIPVGTALAALIGNTSHASISQTLPENKSSDVQGTLEHNRTLPDPILQRLRYQVREQAHTLTLHQSSSGVMYAGHGSHASHASHQSHRSGY